MQLGEKDAAARMEEIRELLEGPSPPAL